MQFLEQQRALARDASQKEDWQGALNIWEMLRNGFLDASEIFIGRGDALQALGRLDEAAAEYRAALHIHATSVIALRNLAAVLLEQHQRNIEAIRAVAKLENGVVFFDLSDKEIGPFNKFITYYLFPEARYSVGLTSASARFEEREQSKPGRCGGQSRVSHRHRGSCVSCSNRLSACVLGCGCNVATGAGDDGDGGDDGAYRITASGLPSRSPLASRAAPAAPTRCAWRRSAR